MLKTLTLRQLLTLQAAASLFMLVAALTGQYGFDLHPCHLCILQRYPYIAIALIAGVASFLPERWRVIAAWVCVVLFAADAGIATYHGGVEAGIFPGPSGCTTQGTSNMTLEEMRAQIMNAPLVSCDQAMIHIFGLSMAAWNALAATFFTVFSIVILRRKNI